MAGFVGANDGAGQSNSVQDVPMEGVGKMRIQKPLGDVASKRLVGVEGGLHAANEGPADVVLEQLALLRVGLPGPGRCLAIAFPERPSMHGLPRCPHWRITH